MNINDNNLIKEYLGGDEKSFEVLIQRYLKLIYNFVYRKIGNINEAEDITQEIFLKVWQHRVYSLLDVYANCCQSRTGVTDSLRQLNKKT